MQASLFISGIFGYEMCLPYFMYVPGASPPEAKACTDYYSCFMSPRMFLPSISS